MRVAPSEVLQLAVRAESARQPNLARELYILAARMDRGPMPDGLEPSGSPDLDCVFVLWNESHSPACKSCVENTHARSAAWSRGCGLGKTPMQLTWADNVVRHVNRPVLVLTPLAVGSQTVREAVKFGFDAEQSRDGWSSKPIVVTNYEKLHLFRPGDFGGVVLDE